MDRVSGYEPEDWRSTRHEDIFINMSSIRQKGAITVMKNNKTWTSPTHEKLSLEEIPQYIRDYYNLMK